MRCAVHAHVSALTCGLLYDGAAGIASALTSSCVVTGRCSKTTVVT